MRRLFFGLAFCLSALSATAYASGGGDAILGTWLTNDGGAKVQIVNDHGIYNGRILWLKEPLFPAGDSKGMAGKPKVDRLNPEPSLRARPLIGLTLISGLHYAGDNEWKDGKMYAPAKGKSYDCKLTLAPDGRLKIRVGGSFFGKTIYWTRAATPAKSK